MQRFERPIIISGVAMGEFRATNIGPSPRMMGRFAYMAEDGSTCGAHVHHTFSERTHQLFRQFCASAEDDLVRALTVPGSELAHGEIEDQQEDSEDGLSFP